MVITYRETKVDRKPLVTKEDIFFCLELPLLLIFSWVLPERAWKGACFHIEQIKARLNFFSPESVQKIASSALPEKKLGSNARTFSLRHAAGRSEHHLQILRSHHPSGWNPRVILEGSEHLEGALASENGAVLWVAHFCFNALAVKKALSDAGFKVWHLSRPEHGFSKSRFGIRFLNPIRVRAELRHLAGRIIIDRANPSEAKRSAERLLRENKIISITAGAWEGRRIATMKILNGTIEVATGAPNLAERCNAALLPVFTVRDDHTGAIRVIVDPPLTIPCHQDTTTCVTLLTQEFGNRLEPHVLAHPDQWRDWKNLQINHTAAPRA